MFNSFSMMNELGHVDVGLMSSNMLCCQVGDGLNSHGYHTRSLFITILVELLLSVNNCHSLCTVYILK